MARTTLDLDEELIAEALETTGAPSKKAVIEEGLRELINTRKRQRLIDRVGSGEIEMAVEELLERRRSGWRDFSAG
jgi:Arc/MetJ family transcription regulator